MKRGDGALRTEGRRVLKKEEKLCKGGVESKNEKHLVWEAVILGQSNKMYLNI